jgi:hypothetical protein
MRTAATQYHLQYDSQRLLLRRDEVQWTARLGGQPDRSDVVVNFGCGQQLTPHLMLETVDVLAALGMTVTAVAGSQWCCGVAVEDEGDEATVKVVRGSVRHMAKYEPHTTVHACGGWWPQTAKLRARGDDVPFGLAYIADFVMQALERRLDEIEWQATQAVPTLMHMKTPEIDAETLAERGASVGIADARVSSIMEMIPSVRVVGEIERVSCGSPCDEGPDGNLLFDNASPAQLAAVKTELADEAERRGAQQIVCVHHACSREWGKFASERLPIRHYISVLAEAMGLARPNRYHKCWALPTLDDIVEETRPAWQSWDLSREEAAALAADIFPSHQPV